MIINMEILNVEFIQQFFDRSLPWICVSAKDMMTLRFPFSGRLIQARLTSCFHRFPFQWRCRPENSFQGRADGRPGQSGDGRQYLESGRIQSRSGGTLRTLRAEAAVRGAECTGSDGSDRPDGSD